MWLIYSITPKTEKIYKLALRYSLEAAQRTAVEYSNRWSSVNIASGMEW